MSLTRYGNSRNDYRRARTAFAYPCLTVVALLLVFFSRAAIAATTYAPESLLSRDNQADYIAIAPAAFEDALAPLLDHRTGDGLNVVLATTDAINDEFGMHVSGADRVEAFVRYAYYQWKKPAPEYLLIVGDAPAPGATETTGLEVPTNLLNSIYKGNRDRGELIASDVAYGDVDADGAPDIATGRIPAADVDELSAVIEKIIRYETWPPAGLWKRRLTLFASVGDFGAIDKMIEKMYKSMIKANVGPEFDINMTYANPKMPYLFVPDRFNEKVIQRYNDGSIMMLYIGHGFTRGFDVVEWRDKRYPIMAYDDAAILNAAGRTPFMVIIACLTGNFDAPGGASVSEALLRNPDGPVGVIAASIISQPYSNTVLNMTLFKSVFKDRVPTLGKALQYAQRDLLFGSDTKERRLIDRFGRSIHTPDEMRVHNRETVYAYNLLGDPATRVQLPGGRVGINAPREATAGDVIEVTGSVSNVRNGEAHVELACFPTEIIYPISDVRDLEGAEFEKAVEQNYENANNKTVWETVVEVRGGKFALELPLPEWLPRKVFFVKAYAMGGGRDAIGATPIRVSAKK